MCLWPGQSYSLLSENSSHPALAICFFSLLWQDISTVNCVIRTQHWKSSFPLQNSSKQCEHLSSITYQIQEPPHSILMAAHALTGVKAAFCHIYATSEWKKKTVRNRECMWSSGKMQPVVSAVLNCSLTETPMRKGGDCPRTVGSSRQHPAPLGLLHWKQSCQKCFCIEFLYI